MRCYYILPAVVLVAGCATQRRASVVTASASEIRPIVQEAVPTHTVETRYEIRSYRDGHDVSVRHEPHAVYRTTRVPTRMPALETVPRTEFAPLSHAPLPTSAELSAEIAAQKQITAELHAIQGSMAAVEQKAKTQYGTLVNQTAETIKLRKELEDERARVQALEAQLRNGASSATSTPATTTATGESRW